MTYREFGDLRSLPRQDLEALLRSGDGPERVWAAWELSLRSGEGAVPALTPQGEPDPGVRSHLVVVLAGLGQLELLRTLAALDPDPGVRAVACDYLLRTTPDEQVARTAHFLQQRARAEDSAVPVVRILEQWPGAWPGVESDALERLSQHPVAAVRLALVDYLDRVGGDVGFLLKSLAREPDRDVLFAMASLVGPEAAMGVLARRAEEEPALSSDILGFLAAAGLTLSWDLVRSHLASDDPLVVHRALLLTDHASCASFSEYITQLGRVMLWGRYEMPHGAFALSEEETARRQAYHASMEIANERLWKILESRVPLPSAITPVLDSTLSRLEDDLRYLVEEEAESLEEESVDLAEELAELNRRRRIVLRAKQQIPSH